MPTETALRYDLGQLAPRLAEGWIVLTPNFRLARRIKAQWDQEQVAAGLDCWRPVAVHALETFLQEEWRRARMAGQVPERRLLSGLQLKELWQQVIEADIAEEGSFSLMQLGAAAELAQDARENLLRACVPRNDGALRSEFGLDEDCASFYRWLMRFEQRLQELSGASRNDLLTDLLAAAPPGEQRRVILLDFDDIAPLHRRCLERRVQSLEEMSGARGETQPLVQSYPDRESELDAVSDWAARQHRENPHQSLGIVLADMNDRGAIEYALRRSFDCLGENYTALPVNFSSGISLDRAPVIRDALRILRCLEDAIPLEDARGLLCSRFTAPSDAGSDALVHLLQQLYREGQGMVDTGRLRFLAQQADDPPLMAGVALRETDLLRLKRQRQTPSQWVEPFLSVLTLWGWPGETPLDSLEYQQVQSFYEVLDQFAGFDAIAGALHLSAAIGLLQRCCQEQVSQPQTADSPVQVLGPLEGAGLHFDALWLCGLQGSRWPPPARPNPFLPISLQRRYDMPHASSEREWAFASGLLQQYRGACKSLVVSYARQMDGVPEIPSPLLGDAPISHLEHTAAVPQEWEARQLAAQVSVLDDSRAAPVSELELGRLRGGSSLLQNQASCPFKAYAAGRLSLEPLGEEVPGLSAADRGSLLHSALFALWGEIGDSDTLSTMDTASRVAASERAAAAAIYSAPGGLRQLAGMGCMELEQDRLTMLLQEWLALEVTRSPFVVTAREAPVELNLAGLPLSLRVDRVDELADGSRLVIDYKSGRNSLSAWLGERLSQPQLPLYGVAVGVEGIAFAQVRARDCKFTGVGAMEGVPGLQSDIEKATSRSAVEVDSWAGLVEHWRVTLERLATDFLTGDARVDPDPSACNFCGFQALCRIALVEEEGA